jgi:hypothetical protein
MTPADREFGEAIAALLKTDRPRCRRWLMAGACLQLELAVAKSGNLRRERPRVLRELTSGEFKPLFRHLSAGALAQDFDRQWERYNEIGGWAAWWKIEDARPAGEVAP